VSGGSCATGEKAEEEAKQQEDEEEEEEVKRGKLASIQA
jgi:hypothetical protein